MLHGVVVYIRRMLRDTDGRVRTDPDDTTYVFNHRREASGQPRNKLAPFLDMQAMLAGTLCAWPCELAAANVAVSKPC